MGLPNKVMPKLTEVTKIPTWWVEQELEQRRLEEARKRQNELIRASKRSRREERQIRAIDKARRMARNYFECMESLKVMDGRQISMMCAGHRTKKKARNTFSREEAGTCGNMVTTKRFRNSRLICVCKTKMY